MIEQLKQSFPKLETSAKECKIAVNNGFAKLIENLEIKKQHFIEECLQVKNLKNEKLEEQLHSLKSYCKSIEDGKHRYEQFINDTNMDINERKIAILEMIDDIINQSKVSLVIVTQPKISFIVHQKQVNICLLSFLFENISFFCSMQRLINSWKVW